MTDAVLARLRELVLDTDATSWSNAQLRDQLVLDFPHLAGSLHPTSVSKALAKMGITIKKPSVLAVNAMRTENVDKRRRFARRFFRNVDAEAIGDYRREAAAFRNWKPLLDPELVFFGDQSGFNQTTANARKARSPRGMPAPALRPYVKGRNHSLMLIAGHRDGIVASDVIQGGYNRERLVAFFRTHFIPYIRRYRRSLPASKRHKTIRLVLDNAPIHTAQSVRDLLMDEARVRLTYLPPYSPVLNPCENVFAMLKTRMRGDPFGDPDPLGPADERSRYLVEHIYLHLSSILGEHVRAFYRHCAWGRPGPGDVELFAQLPFPNGM
jgi:transposase